MVTGTGGVIAACVWFCRDIFRKCLKRRDTESIGVVSKCAVSLLVAPSSNGGGVFKDREQLQAHGLFQGYDTIVMIIVVYKH